MLLVYFHWKLNLKNKIFVEASGKDCMMTDVANTMVKNMDIFPNLVAALALSDCDTIASYPDKGELTAVKKLREGAQLNSFVDVSADVAMATEQATLFISHYSGFRLMSMTGLRIQLLIQKTSKACKSAPSVKNLLPTTQAFLENVKRAILQTMISHLDVEGNPLKVDPALYGWMKDVVSNILVAVSLPDNISSAPEVILDVIL